MRVGVVHPSALHWAVACPRRFVGMHGVDQLPPTLAAVRGRILHAVREVLSTQLDRTPAGLRAAAELAFLGARANEQSRLEQQPWWIGWFDLEDHLRWQWARATVLPAANRLAGTSPAPRRILASKRQRIGVGAGDESKLLDHLDPLPGVEVRISSAGLRLSGVIDEVRASADGWIVVEMKSTEGAAASAAAGTQVLAYALAIESLGAGTVSHCEVLGPRGPTTVDFDASARQTASELIQLALEVDGSEALPSSSHCSGCPVRDHCPDYRKWTELQWEQAQLPANGDLWGRVGSVSAGVAETRTIELDRPDGTRVTVRGVPNSRSGVDFGAQVAAFGLSSTGTWRLHGRATAPTALHERSVGVARGLLPAWGVAWRSAGQPLATEDLPEDLSRGQGHCEMVQQPHGTTRGATAGVKPMPP